MKSADFLWFGGKKTRGHFLVPKNAPQTIIDVRPLLKVGWRHDEWCFDCESRQTIVLFDNFPTSKEDSSDQRILAHSTSVHDKWSVAKAKRAARCFSLTKGFFTAHRLKIPNSWTLRRTVLLLDDFVSWSVIEDKVLRRESPTMPLNSRISRSLWMRGLPDLGALTTVPRSSKQSLIEPTVVRGRPKCLAVSVIDLPAFNIPTTKPFVSVVRSFRFALAIYGPCKVKEKKKWKNKQKKRERYIKR